MTKAIEAIDRALTFLEGMDGVYTDAHLIAVAAFSDSPHRGNDAVKRAVIL